MRTRPPTTSARRAESARCHVPSQLGLFGQLVTLDHLQDGRTPVDAIEDAVFGDHCRPAGPEIGLRVAGYYDGELVGQAVAEAIIEALGIGKHARRFYLEVGRPMVIDEIEPPDPGPTQLLVKHFASGICHTHLHTLHNPQAKVPTLLGHESTAVVTAVGHQVRGITERDHVLLSFMPRQLPGGERPNLPVVRIRGQAIPPSGASSTWSEHAVVDQAFVVPLVRAWRPTSRRSSAVP
jgi:hypothetical protein